MRFTEQRIAGVFIVEAVPQHDERGHFARLFCEQEFRDAGIVFTSLQINISGNPAKHTLRGMHYQNPPYAEAKFVRAVRGRAYDVVVDLRKGSPTERQWLAVELDAKQMNGIYVPEGCAHGFLTLEDNTDILYQMGRPFVAGQGQGVRWNDPAFHIAWPANPKIIAPRDASYPDYGG